MWNPLASLPPSNAGALSAYAPVPVPVPSVPMPSVPVQTAPVAGQMPLHPIYGMHGNRKGPLDGMANPNAFQSALAAWQAQRPVLGPKVPGMQPSDLLSAWQMQRPLRSSY